MNATPQTVTSCPKCGRSLTALNANFCTYCGTTIQIPALVDDDIRYIGQIIDDSFLVKDAIGVGSMGVVYRAIQLALNKPVALKVLRRSFVTDAVVLERFKREAQAASRLKHANTINVLHYGTTPDGAPYIAMEFLAGTDLSELVSNEFPLETKRVVSLMSQVAAALAEAHSLGIIHRDLKPANIVVTRRREEEVVKVLDFGIAKIQDTEGEGLTRDGLVCGTPAFMSPEQVSGQPVDARSDLFSLGIILYFLLSGQLPFSGDSAVEMASAILMDTPKAPSRVRLGARVSPELEMVCMRALSKSPDDRYQSADEFRMALEDAYQEHLAKGGDERLEAASAVVAGGASTDITQGHAVATVMHQEALSTPAPTMTSGRKKWVLPLALGIGVTLIAVVLAVALTRSGGEGSADGATRPGAENAFEADTLSRPSAVGSATAGGVGALWPTPFTAQPQPDDPVDLDFTNDVTEGDSGTEDGEEGAEDEEEPEDRELTRAEKRAKRREDAEDYYRKAKRIWRSNPQRAIRQLKRATRYHSSNWRYWELLGDVYLRVAKRKEAAKAYKKVLKHNPRHPRRRILQKQIEAGGL